MQEPRLTKNVKFIQKAFIMHPNENTTLVLQRAVNDPVRPNDWDLAGGNVEFGEKANAALKREIQEECQLEVDKLEPLFIKSWLREDEVYTIYVVYECKALTAQVVLSAEHQAYQWVKAEKFINMTQSETLKEATRKVLNA